MSSKILKTKKFTEEERLQRLADSGLVGTHFDSSFESIVVLGSGLCQATVCAIGLVDEAEVWIHAAVGVSVGLAPRPGSFHDRVVRAQEEVELYENARNYFGVPLSSEDGAPIGCLYVMTKNNVAFRSADKSALRHLAHLTQDLLHKAARAEKLESLQRLSTSTEKTLVQLLEHMPMAVISKNIQDDFRFEFWNNRAEQLFGHSKEAILHKTDFDLFPLQQAQFFRSIDVQTIASDGVVDIPEEVVSTPQGERFLHTRKLITLDKSGRPRSLIVLCDDITDEKKSKELAQEVERTVLLAREQAALEASRLKSEFIANVSHELRTPLNGVFGMAQILMETSLNDLQREYLHTMISTSKTLMTHIDNILELSNLDSGKITINAQKVALRPFIEDLLASHREPEAVNNVHMDLTIDANVPEFVNIDSARLSQVLNSLIGNSLKFTQEGAISVRVNTLDSGSLRFEVLDTGIGIEDLIKPTIFSAFMPGDASLTKRHAGVGIGLALSKRLVELMGGQIDFDSSKGSGSRFWFSLPDASVRSRPEFGRSAPLVPEKHSQHLSILIAEDNAVNLKVLLAMLPKDCFEVHIAQDGRQAVDLFLRKSFDLILMDCQMPHLSGLDATTAIRRLEQKVGLRRTPIIAVTAMSMDGDREKCFSVGMDDHLSKPVHRKVLLASLQRWLPASACGS